MLDEFVDELGRGLGADGAANRLAGPEGHGGDLPGERAPDGVRGERSHRVATAGEGVLPYANDLAVEGRRGVEAGTEQAVGGVNRPAATEGLGVGGVLGAGGDQGGEVGAVRLGFLDGDEAGADADAVEGCRLSPTAAGWRPRG